MAAKGLMRFPAFVRSIYSAIRSQQPLRAEVGEPSLFYPELRSSDVYVISFFAISIFAIRCLFQYWLGAIMFKNFSSAKQRKLSENLLYTIYYLLAFTYFVVGVYPQAEWSTNLLSNTSDVMEDLLFPFPCSITEPERMYYAQAFGFYISASIFLLFLDTRRSDFVEFLIHHVVTLTMVVLGFLYGYIRVAMVILALHDIADIFLYGAKFVHYLGMKGLDTALFACMAVSFYFTRLVMYSRVTHSIVIGTISRLASEPPFNRWAMFYDTYLVHYVIFVGALCTLLCLHCFWFGLILKLIYREVFLGEKISDEGDSRSDDED